VFIVWCRDKKESPKLKPVAYPRDSTDPFFGTGFKPLFPERKFRELVDAAACAERAAQNFRPGEVEFILEEKSTGKWKAKYWMDEKNQLQKLLL